MRTSASTHASCVLSEWRPENVTSAISSLSANLMDLREAYVRMKEEVREGGCEEDDVWRDGVVDAGRELLSVSRMATLVRALLGRHGHSSTLSAASTSSPCEVGCSSLPGQFRNLTAAEVSGLWFASAPPADVLLSLVGHEFEGERRPSAVRWSSSMNTSVLKLRIQSLEGELEQMKNELEKERRKNEGIGDPVAIMSRTMIKVRKQLKEAQRQASERQMRIVELETRLVRFERDECRGVSPLRHRRHLSGDDDRSLSHPLPRHSGSFILRIKELETQNEILARQLEEVQAAARKQVQDVEDAFDQRMREVMRLSGPRCVLSSAFLQSSGVRLHASLSVPLSSIRALVAGRESVCPEWMEDTDVNHLRRAERRVDKLVEKVTIEEESMADVSLAVKVRDISSIYASLRGTKSDGLSVQPSVFACGQANRSRSPRLSSARSESTAMAERPPPSSTVPLVVPLACRRQFAATLCADDGDSGTVDSGSDAPPRIFIPRLPFRLAGMPSLPQDATLSLPRTERTLEKENMDPVTHSFSMCESPNDGLLNASMSSDLGVVSPLTDEGDDDCDVRNDSGGKDSCSPERLHPRPPPAPPRQSSKSDAGAPNTRSRLFTQRMMHLLSADDRNDGRVEDCSVENDGPPACRDRLLSLSSVPRLTQSAPVSPTPMLHESDADVASGNIDKVFSIIPRLRLQPSIEVLPRSDQFVRRSVRRLNEAQRLLRQSGVSERFVRRSPYSLITIPVPVSGRSERRPASARVHR